MHENQLHDHSCFVTLTYDDEHLGSSSLVYDHFQKFMRDLRYRRYGKRIRFFVAGEYGEQYRRPHFHAILFGCRFPDQKYFKTLDSGFKLYTSEELSQVWGKGFTSVGAVSFESAAYVARYVMKKVNGNNAAIHYSSVHPVTGETIDLEPEFCHMSLKPGIGADWYKKYAREVFPKDAVVINGKKVKPPRYYAKQFAKDPNFDALDRIYREQQIFDKLELIGDDASPDRLSVREVCAKARLSLKKRGL